MDQDTLEELRVMLTAHANVVRCMAAVHRMRTANDNARSQGKEDRFDTDAFKKLEDEVALYANQLDEG